MLFLVLHTVHFLYFPVRVVLYDALMDVLLTLGFALAVSAAWRRVRFRISGMEVGLALFIGRLMAIIYAITFPTIIDRSLSGYVLEKLVQRGGAIRFDTWDAVI